LSSQDILVTLIGVFVLGAIAVAANYADYRQNSSTRLAVIGVLILGNILLVLNGIGQVMSAYSSGLTSSNPPTKGDAWGALIVSIIVSGLATLVLMRPVAERLAVVFPRFHGEEKPWPGGPLTDEPAQPESLTPGEPLFPQMLNYYTTDSLMVPRSSPAVPLNKAKKSGYAQMEGFNPASLVHLVAIIYVLYFFGVQFISFILGGGLKGVAETYQQQGLSVLDLILNALPFVVLPILGVGFGLRRNLWQTLKRLGLEFPTGQGVLVSFGVTVGLFVFVAIVSSLWINLVPENVYKEQTQASDALSNSVTSVGLAFLLAATAAVGEEIAFRGALQPVFGFWPTAIIFAMTHIQYTLTPAWLIIFGVALAFGWLRMRFNTTASMLTHFLYDFIPLVLTISAPQGLGIWVLKLF
jgi:membrane protease YdiL (CAAX protease family)